MTGSLGIRVVARLTAELLSRLSMFVFFLVLARMLGAGTTGHYATVFSFFSLLIVLTDLGTNLTAVREISRNQANILFWLKHIFPLRIGLIILFLLLSWLAASLWTWQTEEINLLLPVASFLLLNSVLDGLFHLFQAVDRQVDESALKVIQRFGIAGAGVSGLILTNSLATALWWMVGIQILVFLAGLFWFVKIGSQLQLKSDTIDSQLIPFLKIAIPLGLSAFVTTIYLRIDVVMMNYFEVDAFQIGWYQAAARGHDFAHTISVLAFGALVPSLNRWYHEKHTEFPVWVNRSLRLLLLWTVTIAAGSMTLAPDFFLLLFGSDFDGSGHFARLLFWGLVPMSVNLVLLHLLLFRGATGWSLMATTASMMINVVGNFFLIPELGPVGAAISTIASETALTLILLTLIYRKEKIAGVTAWMPSMILYGVFVGLLPTVLNTGHVWLTMILSIPLLILAVRLLNLATETDWRELMAKRPGIPMAFTKEDE